MDAMSDKRHLILPEAATPFAPRPPEDTANLRALLAALVPGSRVDAGEGSLSPPCDIAAARALGLPHEDGRIPWAAVETGTVGTPCAWLRLCHWRIGADHVLLVPARQMALDAATTATFMDAMAPYFLEDGIALRPVPGMPGLLLATGEVFRGLPTLAMQRAESRRLTPDALQPAGATAAVLRRLQNEMQMLLYTHPLNDERQAGGLPVVNSFWIDGAGVLDSPFTRDPSVVIDTRLAAAAPEPAARHAAWRAVDADACAALLAMLREGADVRLTLCGERAAQTFTPAPRGWWPRLQGRLGLRRAWNEFESL